MDLSDCLKKGRNSIGVIVLFYGEGDGTWPIGNPGLIFHLTLEYPDGRKEKIISDKSWKCHLALSWPRGQYKRWYLRSLQEIFDARYYPYGWTEAEFESDQNWLQAMELDCPSDKPSLCSRHNNYLYEITGSHLPHVSIEPRSIPFLKEKELHVERLAEAYWITWNRPPEEYFDCKTLNAFSFRINNDVRETSPGVWEMIAHEAAALTFELNEQAVGWPMFTIEAPEGTICELMVHEAHATGGPPLLNTHFHSWTRFICREGINVFETFDYESFRWMQLHIRNAGGKVIVRDIGLRRRIYPWPNQENIQCDDPALKRLFDASINTLNNSAQEHIVDGMGRERQQYSGDCGHQLHAIYYTFGETRQPARYLKTFSQGMTVDGFFLDCWPAYDRLARLMERQLQLTQWGPLLDHGVGFVFDCYHHYMYTGNLEDLSEPFPRLLKFADYLNSIRREDGLLPVEDLGIPAVWMDHQAYRMQHHKKCAFNLYAAAMFQHALAPICRSFGDTAGEKSSIRLGREILRAVVYHFWSRSEGLFVNNLPWITLEKNIRLCDRSLATAILFNQCPDGNIHKSLVTLVNCPPQMGFSYPANAGWRLWALAAEGRTDVILDDLRNRWAKMESVKLNNTLQEDWTVRPDSGSQWSHCPVVPLYILYMAILGIKPLSPGFALYEVKPQLADLTSISATAYLQQGPLHFETNGVKGNREIRIHTPEGCRGQILLPENETVDLERLTKNPVQGHLRYLLPEGKETLLRLSCV